MTGGYVSERGSQGSDGLGDRVPTPRKGGGCWSLITWTCKEAEGFGGGGRDKGLEMAVRSMQDPCPLSSVWKSKQPSLEKATGDTVSARVGDLGNLLSGTLKRVYLWTSHLHLEVYPEAIKSEISSIPCHRTSFMWQLITPSGESMTLIYFHFGGFSLCSKFSVMSTFEYRKLKIF